MCYISLQKIILERDKVSYRFLDAENDAVSQILSAHLVSEIRFKNVQKWPFCDIRNFLVKRNTNVTLKF